MNEPGAKPAVIALDGPAAAGKSTVGRRLAEQIGALYLDTGAIYRALTVIALEHGADPNDGPAIAALARATAFTVLPAPTSDLGYRVLADGRDITQALRGPEVDRSISAISRHAAVRDALLQLQRELAGAGPVVMVGRDVGTVVMPDADLKLFLLAGDAERAVRRFRERLRAGYAGTYDEVLADVRQRDALDSGRPVAPLVPAHDAVIVNTDGCGIDRVVSHLAALVARWPDPLTVGGGEAACQP